jgi:hypothetical protein
MRKLAGFVYVKKKEFVGEGGLTAKECRELKKLCVKRTVTI